MPVTTLFVEGDLDAQLLAPVLAGLPAIEKGGSKNALAPRVRQERARFHQGTRPDPRYLRDRDYDHLPATELTRPTEDKKDESGLVLGWRWSRHEIENYMLEPALVCRCLGLEQSNFRTALTEAARKIRFYQASRWTIGQARISLPPAYEFNTSPDDRGGKDFYLPRALEGNHQRTWARDHAASFLARITPELDDSHIGGAFDSFALRFSDTFLEHAESILVWFSGKDLMAAMEPWLIANKFKTAGSFRTHMRDWMIAHSEVAVEHLAEWRALRELLRA